MASKIAEKLDCTHMLMNPSRYVVLDLAILEHLHEQDALGLVPVRFSVQSAKKELENRSGLVQGPVRVGFKIVEGKLKLLARSWNPGVKKT